MDYKRFDHTVIARLDKGEEILEQLEIIARQESYMNRNARGRELLSAHSLSKSWAMDAQRRYLSRRMVLYGLWDRELLMIAHSPEREEWLKKRYPQANWVDAGEIVEPNLF